MHWCSTAWAYIPIPSCFNSRHKKLSQLLSSKVTLDNLLPCPDCSTQAVVLTVLHSKLSRLFYTKSCTDCSTQTVVQTVLHRQLSRLFYTESCLDCSTQRVVQTVLHKELSRLFYTKSCPDCFTQRVVQTVQHRELSRLFYTKSFPDCSTHINFLYPHPQKTFVDMDSDTAKNLVKPKIFEETVKNHKKIFQN